MAAKVNYLYGCFATDVLRDARGRLCGLVMANKSGRQAVGRKRSSTPAIAACWRMAAGQFTAYPAGKQPFQRIVIGGQPKAGLNGRGTGKLFPGRRGEGVELISYELEIPMADGSFASFARAEQIARDWTYSADLQIDTDEIFRFRPTG